MRLELGSAATEFSVIATVHDAPAEGRASFTRDGVEHWIEVSGTPLAPYIAQALARRERDEYDSLTTDNGLQRIVRKPLLRLRNWRMRRAA